jgi:hypothetical protein
MNFVSNASVNAFLATDQSLIVDKVHNRLQPEATHAVVYPQTK